MAGVRIDVFKGIRPRVSNRLLPAGEAQIARNVRLGSGALEPWNSLTKEVGAASSSVETIYRMDNAGSPIWLQFNEDVDIVRGPVPDDELERTYYTGLDEPRMTYTTIVGTGAPADYRILGIPAPTTAPTVSGDTVPEDVVTGTVTAFSTPNLKADFTIDQNLPSNVNSWYMALTEGGVPSDNGYEPPGTKRTFRFNFPVGLELRVASVVDTDTITVEDANSGDYVAAGVDNTRSGQTWWRTEDASTTRAGFFRFYLPNGIKLTIANHGLQEGDVIRVTSVATPIGITFTAPANGTTFGGHFFGWESDNGAGDADTNTWPSAPVSVGADDFYRAGATAYPFVDIWVDNDGESSVNSFDIDGQFSYQLIERDGKDYRDIATDIESRVYVYTFVSELGEEGPPSPASEVVTIPTGGSVVVGGFEAPPSTKRNITNMRIYRANTGNESTEFQFVAEIDSPFSDYIDEVAGTDLGEVLQTTTWEPPPEDLEGLTALPNGVLAGFVGKTLYFSEPYFPHAWPPEYKKAVDYDIVGLGVLPNGVAVLTKGSAYIATGDHPRAMSLRHFTTSQSCVSKRSIVSTIDSVIYASPDGLVSIGAGGFRILTSPWMTKREWQDRYSPSTIRGFWHDDKYFGFHDEITEGGVTRGGFVFSPTDASIGLTDLSFVVRAGYLSPEDDKLYVLTVDPEFVPSGTTAFLESGTYTVPAGVTSVDVLVVGAGGQGNQGGGGGGEVVYKTDVAVTPQDEIPVVVGVNDNAIANRKSSFGDIVALGGGRGGSGTTEPAEDGGSGGGGGNHTSGGEVAGGNSIAVEGLGNAGGKGGGSSGSATRAGGGGGGAGAPGRDMTPGNPARGGDGGDGVYFGHVFGDEYGDEGWFGGGGGGDGSNGSIGGSGGRGGGGSGAPEPFGVATAGMDGTGGGGGGNHTSGGYISGGSGVVLIKQSTPLIIAEWNPIDVDDPEELTWRSGDLVLPYPLNLAAGRVLADDYPATFKLYDKAGTLRATRTVNNDGVFRLPGGYVTDTVSVEVTGTSVVRLIHVAETVEELYQG